MTFVVSFSIAYKLICHFSQFGNFCKMLTPTFQKCKLGWSYTKNLPHSKMLSCKVKPNRLMILAFMVSMLALITFLKTLMWTLGSISFTYVRYWGFQYGSWRAPKSLVGPTWRSNYVELRKVGTWGSLPTSNTRKG